MSKGHTSDFLRRCVSKPVTTAAWIQTCASYTGGGCLTVGLWLVLGTPQVVKFPVTWVLGALAFVLGVGTWFASSTMCALLTPKGARFGTSVRMQVALVCLSTLMWAASAWVMSAYPLVPYDPPCAALEWGPQCKPCACVHGTCDDTKLGDGSCTCFPRWNGTLCDECAAHVQSNMADPNGAEVCDFCQPGYKYPWCTRCAEGYTGPDCAQCAAGFQKYQYYADAVDANYDGWGAHPEWGYTPWGERRDRLVPLHESSTLTTEEGLRCDGCLGDRNQRTCVEVTDCTTGDSYGSDPLAVVRPNLHVPELVNNRIVQNDIPCNDDYNCSSWYCMKTAASPLGKCASMSRESFGCECGSEGAVGPSCLYCDSVSQVRWCGKGNCVWKIDQTVTGSTDTVVDPYSGERQCLCEDNWFSYGGAGTNTACTRYMEETTDNVFSTRCLDATYGPDCTPCACDSVGTRQCHDGIQGNGSCVCVEDSVFGGRGLWGGATCNECLPDCHVSLPGCLPNATFGFGIRGYQYCPGATGAA